MRDRTIVLLGSHNDVFAMRKALAATGWPGAQVAVPMTPLFGRRLDIDRLIVLDSWAEELQVPYVREWAENELLCRYIDIVAAATKIGIQL